MASEESSGGGTWVPDFLLEVELVCPHHQSTSIIPRRPNNNSIVALPPHHATDQFTALLLSSRSSLPTASNMLKQGQFRNNKI